MKYSFQKLIECAQRELEMRKKVYPGQVAKQTMSSAEAKDQIGMMKEIVDILTRLELEAREVFATRSTKAEGDIERYEMRLHERHIEPLRKLGIDDPRILATYVGGYLDSLTNLRVLTEKHPNTRLDVKACTNSSLVKLVEHSEHESWHYTPIMTGATDQKIAAFCLAYERAFGQKYKAGPFEGSQWKGKYAEVPAIAEDLDYYMTSTGYPLNGPKTIENYLRYALQLPEIRRSAADSSSEYKFKLPPTAEELKKIGDPAKREAYIAWMMANGYRARYVEAAGPGGRMLVIEKADMEP